MDFAADLAGASAAEIKDIVDIWLWGFSEPDRWPSVSDVILMVKTLESLPISTEPDVLHAIENCRDYIRT